MRSIPVDREEFANLLSVSMSFEEPRLDGRPNATTVLLVAFVEIYREQDLKRAEVVLEKTERGTRRMRGTGSWS